MVMSKGKINFGGKTGKHIWRRERNDRTLIVECRKIRRRNLDRRKVLKEIGEAKKWIREIIKARRKWEIRK